MTLQTLKVGLNIAVVQLHSMVGHTYETILRATNLLNKLKTDCMLGKVQKPDLVVFPEFALTGYNFRNRSQILSHTSIFNDGVSYKLALELSKALDCITIIGYPERETLKNDSKLFNSALVVGRNGDILFNYRKSFLYYTDEDWGCCENPEGFKQFTLTFDEKGCDSKGTLHDVSLKTSIGICMDLSPYRFMAPFNDFEFATFNADHMTELIICPMAWLHSNSVTKDTLDPSLQIEENKRLLEMQDIPASLLNGDFQYDLRVEGPRTVSLARGSPLIKEKYLELDEPDMMNVNYLILRFLPFLSLRQREEWFRAKQLSPILSKLKAGQISYLGQTEDKSWIFEGRNAVLVLANRCGVEDLNTIFSGSSGIYKFNGESVNTDHLDSLNPSVELLGNLGKGKEGIILRKVVFNIFRNL